MSIVFQMKRIKPKKLKVKEIRLELLNALRKEAVVVKKEYKKTTATWSKKPEFETIISLTGKDASVLVGTDNKIYKFLDKGTKVRWAVMSKDWKSKTTPRKIGSGKGSGKVVIAGRAAMQKRNIKRRPGIKAREFSEVIGDRRRKKFTRRMVKAMQDGTAKAF